MEDIKNGNGNRRILAETHELIAPLAYAINDIILSYEKRLSAYHQTDETNRQLMTSLSHDVRTPLTTLIGYLDAAHKGIVDGKERDDYIETARRYGHSAILLHPNPYNVEDTQRLLEAVRGKTGQEYWLAH